MSARTDFRKLPEVRWRDMLVDIAEAQNLDNPFFRVHESLAGPETRIDGRALLNFGSYDYLSLNGHPRVIEATIAAIRSFGTTVSASRLVSGERPFHHRLERQLADIYGVEDAIVMVSGHATNVSLIGQLLGPQDLLVHDELIHNSIIVGGQLARATRAAFPHNDLEALRKLLKGARGKHRRCCIAVEGLYSMDGDSIDLPTLVELKKEFDAWLLIDEAHALGVLGATGRGTAEAQKVSGTDVDIWTGTLSKTLVSSGGYVAGSTALIDFVKAAAPGFVYSVGLSPPAAAAAIAALEVMCEQPERVARLQANSAHMHKLMRAAGLDTGTSDAAAIAPVRVGDSIRATAWANRLYEAGLNVLPIVYPAVPYDRAILRFFINADHSFEQIERAVAETEVARDEVSRLSLPNWQGLAKLVSR